MAKYKKGDKVFSCSLTISRDVKKGDVGEIVDVLEYYIDTYMVKFKKHGERTFIVNQHQIGGFFAYLNEANKL